MRWKSMETEGKALYDLILAFLCTDLPTWTHDSPGMMSIGVFFRVGTNGVVTTKATLLA